MVINRRHLLQLRVGQQHSIFLLFLLRLAGRFYEFRQLEMLVFLQVVFLTRVQLLELRAFQQARLPLFFQRVGWILALSCFCLKRSRPTYPYFVYPSYSRLFGNKTLFIRLHFAQILQYNPFASSWTNWGLVDEVWSRLWAQTDSFFYELSRSMGGLCCYYAHVLARVWCFTLLGNCG